MDATIPVQATSTLITQYGLAGFVVVVCLLTLVWTLKESFKRSDRKDQESLQKDDKFSKSLDLNSDALNKNTVATDKFLTWLKDAKEQNSKEHGEILDCVRRRHTA